MNLISCSFQTQSYLMSDDPGGPSQPIAAFADPCTDSRDIAAPLISDRAARRRHETTRHIKTRRCYRTRLFLVGGTAAACWKLASAPLLPVHESA